MSYAHRHPPQSLLRDRLRYDPDTGIFYWKIVWTVGGRTVVGDIAGCRVKKYIRINIKPFGQMGAHRLAWIYMRGDIPHTMEIDHIDRNPSNNRFTNLRLATSTEQKRNKRVQTNNRSGLKGAYYHTCHRGKKWRSQIKVDGKYIFLGYFHTAEEAHAAYRSAAVFYFGEFACVA